jgi:hypothetical protein
MSWRQDLAHYHPDTILIIEIAEHFLQTYFHHSAQEAENLLTQFFARFGKWFDETYVRHEHAWGIATEAEFCIHVGGSRGDIQEWRRREGLVATHPNALEYLRKHYWNRDRT